MNLRLQSILRRISAPESFADGLRVLTAMLGVVLFGLLSQHVQAMVAMMLGVIAAALAETEDAWRRRLYALMGMLACFLLAAFIVQWLFAVQWAFAIGLAVGSFVLVMLGAASPRFATIAFATLLLAVYTMIGMDHPGAAQLPSWEIPLLLAAGALWYGLLAVGWSALFVHHAVRHSLARVYKALGHYLAVKSALFEPVRRPPMAQINAQLAEANKAVVDALNGCRMSLVDRLNQRRRHAVMERSLRLYLTAQDIHERAASTHYPYQELNKAFFHSDVMFRGQRMMRALAETCAARGEALRLGEDFTPPPQANEALVDLRDAIDWQRDDPRKLAEDMLQSVERLADNLSLLLARICSNGGEEPASDDDALHDPSPTGMEEAWQRIRLRLTPASARFRHALRLSLAMLVGYVVLTQVRPVEGYWILLTIMLVCQPSLDATRKRVLQRVGGTAIGVVVGWVLLKLVPDVATQMELTVAASVLFFVTRYRLYTVATAAITVFVLLAFNQIGNGSALILPRLLDTLIGCLIAVAATFLVLPDWRERELRQLFARLLSAHARYLRAIAAQYTRGKRDDLPYRLARRDSHEADAVLSAHLANSLQDPVGQRADPEMVLRILGASRELLAHLSTLGAHRQRLPEYPPTNQLISQADYLADDMESLAGILQTTGLTREAGPEPVLPEVVDESSGEPHPGQQLVATQLRLLRAQHPILRALSLQLRAIDGG